MAISFKEQATVKLGLDYTDFQKAIAGVVGGLDRVEKATKAAGDESSKNLEKISNAVSTAKEGLELLKKGIDLLKRGFEFMKGYSQDARDLASAMKKAADAMGEGVAASKEFQSGMKNLANEGNAAAKEIKEAFTATADAIFGAWNAASNGLASAIQKIVEKVREIKMIFNLDTEGLLAWERAKIAKDSLKSRLSRGREAAKMGLSTPAPDLSGIDIGDLIDIEGAKDFILDFLGLGGKKTSPKTGARTTKPLLDPEMGQLILDDLRGINEAEQKALGEEAQARINEFANSFVAASQGAGDMALVLENTVAEIQRVIDTTPSIQAMSAAVATLGEVGATAGDQLASGLGGAILATAKGEKSFGAAMKGMATSFVEAVAQMGLVRGLFEMGMAIASAAIGNFAAAAQHATAGAILLGLGGVATGVTAAISAGGSSGAVTAAGATAPAAPAQEEKRPSVTNNVFVQGWVVGTQKELAVQVGDAMMDARQSGLMSMEA